MRITIISLFPEFFDGPLSVSIPARVIQAGLATVDFLQPRDFATNVHRTVDDTPYGGGAGMVMRAPELAAAVTSLRDAGDRRPVLLMTPQGPPLRQQHAATLAGEDGFIVVCGRYEGIDERFIERYVDQEVCIGDFVLSGGEPAALCLVDAVLRLLPGALGNDHSAVDESFTDGLLEYPQFTRPPTFEDIDVPEVLRSGDHGRVARWRRKVSLLRTEHRRPDLWQHHELSRDDQRVLADERLAVESWLYLPRKRSTNR